MGKKTAVVSDSAGTLHHMYRIVKSTASDEMPDGKSEIARNRVPVACEMPGL